MRVLREGKHAWDDPIEIRIRTRKDGGGGVEGFEFASGSFFL